MRARVQSHSQCDAGGARGAGGMGAMVASTAGLRDGGPAFVDFGAVFSPDTRRKRGDALYCIALHCIALYLLCTVLHCTVL